MARSDDERQTVTDVLSPAHLPACSHHSQRGCVDTRPLIIDYQFQTASHPRVVRPLELCELATSCRSSWTCETFSSYSGNKLRQINLPCSPPLLQKIQKQKNYVICYEFMSRGGLVDWLGGGLARCLTGWLSVDCSVGWLDSWCVWTFDWRRRDGWMGLYSSRLNGFAEGAARQGVCPETTRSTQKPCRSSSAGVFLSDCLQHNSYFSWSDTEFHFPLQPTPVGLGYSK